jgi:hypothetical protein
MFPILAVVTYFAGTITQIYLAHDATFSEVTAGTTIGKLVTANYTLSLVVCVYTTALISFRILKNSHALRSVGIEHVLGPVLHIVVESAAVYSALTLFVLVSRNKLQPNSYPSRAWYCSKLWGCRSHTTGV